MGVVDVVVGYFVPLGLIWSVLTLRKDKSIKRFPHFFALLVYEGSVDFINFLFGSSIKCFLSYYTVSIHLKLNTG